MIIRVDFLSAVKVPYAGGIRFASYFLAKDGWSISQDNNTGDVTLLKGEERLVVSNCPVMFTLGPEAAAEPETQSVASVLKRRRGRSSP